MSKYVPPDGFWEEAERAAWDKSFRSEHARNPLDSTELDKNQDQRRQSGH